MCDIAGRLIARAGLEAVTVREVALEAQCSTRFVSHYFRSKEELLLLVFMEFSGRTLERCRQALERDDDLAAALEEVLPLDAERRMYWQVWLAFWGRIASDQAFKEAQVVRGHAMRELIEELLRAKERDAAPDHDWRFEGDRLLTTIVGIATQGIFDPDRWDEARQRRHLGAEIEALRKARHLG